MARKKKYSDWEQYKDGVEVMISENPRVTYVRSTKGIVAFPDQVAKKFKNLAAIVKLVEPFLEEMEKV